MKRWRWYTVAVFAGLVALEAFVYAAPVPNNCGLNMLCRVRTLIVSGDATFTGDAGIAGNLTVTGTLTAGAEAITTLTASIVKANVLDGGTLVVTGPATISGPSSLQDVTATVITATSVTATSLISNGNVVAAGGGQFVAGPLIVGDGATTGALVTVGTGAFTLTGVSDGDVTIIAPGAGELALQGQSVAITGATSIGGVAVSPPFDFVLNTTITTLVASGTVDVAEYGAMGSAATITASTWTPGVIGAGVGNFVFKLCSDSACAATTYVTCTAACTAAVGTAAACTINSAAVAAAADPFLKITTACGTTNPVGAFVAHLKQP